MLQEGAGVQTLELSLEDLKTKLPKVTSMSTCGHFARDVADIAHAQTEIVATIQCAGNRCCVTHTFHF